MAWQPTPVFLPGESAWTEEPAILQAIGFQKVRRNLCNLSCMHAHKTRDINYDIENIKLVGWGMRVKMCNFRMSSNLSCRLKVDCYKYNIFYVRLTVTSKQKSIVDTKKVSRMSSKHTTTENHQITEKKSKRRKAQRNY